MGKRRRPCQAHAPRAARLTRAPGARSRTRQHGQVGQGAGDDPEFYRMRFVPRRSSWQLAAAACAWACAALAHCYAARLTRGRALAPSLGLLPRPKSGCCVPFTSARYDTGAAHDCAVGFASPARADHAPRRKSRPDARSWPLAPGFVRKTFGAREARDFDAGVGPPARPLRSPSASDASVGAGWRNTAVPPEA
ncbi:hypothetical protein ACSSS7_005953 [Eimeria intestinalis]